MGRVEIIEQQVQALSREELARFRAWFFEFDGAEWDRQIEQDVRTGKLDALAEKALRDRAPRQLHIYSPRLAHHEQAAGFVKQIVEVSADA